MCNSLGKRFIEMTTQRFFTDEKIFEVMEKAKEECRKNPTKYAQLKPSLKFKKKMKRNVVKNLLHAFRTILLTHLWKTIL